MKKALTLALLGALAVSPAMARGMGEQRSDIHSGQQSSQLDQNTARQVQQQLQQQGYDVGQVDGKWGQKSRQALMNYQRDQNMQASGRPDPQTLAALGVQSNAQQAQTPSDIRRQDQQQQQPLDQNQSNGSMGR